MIILIMFIIIALIWTRLQCTLRRMYMLFVVIRKTDYKTMKMNKLILYETTW